MNFLNGYLLIKISRYNVRMIFAKENIMNNKIPQTTIYTQTINTPLGDMVAYATDNGLCFLKFSDQEKSEKILQQLLKNLNGTLKMAENNVLIQTRQELAEYFAGRRQTFQTPLHIVGTDFQQTVWNTLRTISYGNTISYGEQAKRMQKGNAVRAVANANGHNRISIIIPCHRVIGSNGALTGYAGGLERKKWLLAFEKGIAENS